MTPRLLCETISAEINSQADFIAIQSDVCTPADILLEIKRTEADVLMITSEECGKIAGIYTHLFAEFSGLHIIAFSPTENRAFVFWQEILVREIRISLDAVLATLHSVRIGHQSEA